MTDRTTLSLFDPPAPPRHTSARKARALAKHEAKSHAFLELLRTALRVEYARVQRPLTTDDAWRLMEEREELALPADLSPNVLGGVFVGDRDEKGRGRWKVLGYAISEREKANGNLLRSWSLVES